MKLSELLRAEHVVVPLRAADVREGIAELADCLARSGALANPDALTRKLDAAAGVEPAPVAAEILLIHLRTDAVRDPVPAIGVWEHAVAFEERGRERRARVLVLLLMPPRTAAAYLPAVAALSRTLREGGVAERLRAARSARDVLAIEELGNVPIPMALMVKDAMTKESFRIFPDTPLSEIAELMIRHRLHTVPVVGEKHEVLGMVTSREILRHVVPRGAAAEAEAAPADAGALTLSARKLMTRSVLCVSEEQSLLDVANLMLSKKVDEFPVVREGVLTGFITRGDLLRGLFGR